LCDEEKVRIEQTEGKMASREKERGKICRQEKRKRGRNTKKGKSRKEVRGRNGEKGRR
jgi:hypothetical protein